MRRILACFLSFLLIRMSPRSVQQQVLWRAPIPRLRQDKVLDEQQHSCDLRQILLAFFLLLFFVIVAMRKDGRRDKLATEKGNADDDGESLREAFPFLRELHEFEEFLEASVLDLQEEIEEETLFDE